MIKKRIAIMLLLAATSGMSMAQNKDLKPLRGLATGLYTFNIDLQMIAEGLQMELEVHIEREGNQYVITESSMTPMGKSVDEIILDGATLYPIRRRVSQDPNHVFLEYSPDKVSGNIKTAVQEIPVSVPLSGPLFAEGPGSMFVLATLPINEGYTNSYNYVDFGSMSVKKMNMQVTSELLDDGRLLYRVLTLPADGSEGGSAFWVDTTDYSIIRFEQVVPNTGGSIMRGDLIKKIVK